MPKTAPLGLVASALLVLTACFGGDDDLTSSGAIRDISPTSSDPTTTTPTVPAPTTTTALPVPEALIVVCDHTGRLVAFGEDGSVRADIPGVVDRFGSLVPSTVATPLGNASVAGVKERGRLGCAALHWNSDFSRVAGLLSFVSEDVLPGSVELRGGQGEVVGSLRDTTQFAAEAAITKAAAFKPGTDELWWVRLRDFNYEVTNGTASFTHTIPSQELADGFELLFETGAAAPILHYQRAGGGDWYRLDDGRVEFRGDLFDFGLLTGRDVPLPASDLTVGNLVLSPDGATVAFLAGREGTGTGLWTIPRSGGEPTRIATLPADLHVPDIARYAVMPPPRDPKFRGGDATGAAPGGGADVAETRDVVVDGTALPPFPAAGPDPAVGAPAPRVRGQDFGGNPVTLAGGPRLVVMLAHWSPHAQAQLADLEAWLAAGGSGDVLVSVVSTLTKPDGPNWPPSAWLAGFARDVIADSPSDTAAAAFGTDSIPFFVALNGTGAVAARASGEQAADGLNRLAGAAAGA